MLIETLKHSLIITGFVFAMMLLIEYLNILSKGQWEKKLVKNQLGQWLLASFLGVTPGCLGAYATTSLYIHRTISFGALTGAMVATCGDEAFVMLAMFPKQALIIFATLFILGIITSIITDFIFKNHFTLSNKHLDQHPTVHNEHCVSFSRSEIITQWKKCSPQRGWLTLFLIIFIISILSGQFAPKHPATDHTTDIIESYNHSEEHTNSHTEVDTKDAEIHSEHIISPEQINHADMHGTSDNWIHITLLLSGLIGLFIIISVPDHFLEEHLWNHIAKVHIWRIFLWTFGALLIVNILIGHTNTATIINENHLPLLLTACLLGIIPESGPHLIFVTLFAEGAAPFSILLASSIAQDGHGMLPLLAHSRRAFLGVKAINILIALIVGLIGYFMGW